MPIALGKQNANQIADRWINFLKECSNYGDDISYTEMNMVGGSHDDVTDQTIGGVLTPSTTIYRKCAVAAPSQMRDTAFKAGYGEAFVLGHQVGGVTLGETYIARLKMDVPLSKTGIYLINGVTYKFTQLLDAMRVGKRVVWNLAMFARS